jgi:hypothetical protein
MSRGRASQHVVRPTCRKVERGVTNVSGSARAVAPRTKIAGGRRRATAGGPPGDTAQRVGYCPSPPRVPVPWSWAAAPPLGKLEPLYPPCCPTFRRPPDADPGASGPPPRPSVLARADPHAAPWTAPRPTDPMPFGRGRPARDPVGAARAEAEPMERSAASQLAIVTRRSLQPPSCPPSERRRAGRFDILVQPQHHFLFPFFSRPRRLPSPWTAPRPTDQTPFDRGRPASDPGAAAGAEAEPMERSAASQLAIVTRRILQPPSCPPSERRRAGRFDILVRPQHQSTARKIQLIFVTATTVSL